MELRTVTAGDLVAVRALNEVSVPAVNAVSADEFAWFLQVADYFRLVEIDGALAGFLLGLRPGLPYASLNYQWFCERYDDFCYIDRLAVDDAFRRRGVASALYADIERRAHEHGAPLLACEVNVKPRNEVSLAFHRHHGFTEVGQQDTDGGNKRVSLMTRSLTNSPGP